VTWIKVDDGITEHPKFAALTSDAWALWLHGTTYASRNRTDGLIPAAMLGRLSNVKNPTRVAAELVAAGLWHEVDAGFEIHDYLEHQRSREQIDADRAAADERQRRSRARRKAASTGDGHAPVTDLSRRDTGDRHAPVTPPETETETETETEPAKSVLGETLRVPEPDTNRRRRILAHARGEARRRWPKEADERLAQAVPRLDRILVDYPAAPDAVVVEYLVTGDGRNLTLYRDTVGA
jgi:hypothetical protein